MNSSIDSKTGADRWLRPISIEAVWARCGDQDGRQRLPSQLPDAKVSAILRPSGLQAKKSPGTACILRIRVAGCPCLRIRLLAKDIGYQTLSLPKPGWRPTLNCTL